MLVHVALIGLLIAVLPIVRHLALVGGGFTSKTVCSGVFLSNRPLKSISENELAGLSAMLFVPVIDHHDRRVTTSLLGMSPYISDILNFPTPSAVFLGPKFGCQLQIYPVSTDSSAGFDFVQARDEDSLFALEVPVTSHTNAPVPLENFSSNDSSADAVRQCVRDVVQWQFTHAAYKTNQTRATVVLQGGRVIAEGYQTSHMGITSETPLLGWSMTKSVFALVVGAAIQRGYLELDSPLLLNGMDGSHRRMLRKLNNNQDLTFRHLLRMDDVLFVEEDYNLLKFIVQALFGAHEISSFVLSNSGDDKGFSLIASKDKDFLGVRGSPTKPLGEPHPDAVADSANFAWYYSSAVSNLLSQELRTRIGDDRKYWALPHDLLFDLIGAGSFVLEMDPSGTFVASSFSYASGRDWAKLGQLLLNKGVWKQEDGTEVRVLPFEFVEFLQQPHPASGGHYGGQIWLNPARVSVAEYNRIQPTHKNKNANAWMTSVLPPDAYFFSGFEGQNVFIIPSLDLVISRLGFTRDISGSNGVTPLDWNHTAYYGGIVQCFQTNK